jgi:MoxR-like ATPase
MKKNTVPVDMQRVRPIAELLKLLEEELNVIFPEREDFVRQIILALLTREHVLVFGPHGAGKSDLLANVYLAIEGATIAKYQLNRFFTQADIFGTADLKILQEESRVHYNPENGILSAEFVELDELFRANGAVLGMLLGILNEREFKRGRQYEKAKLMSAFASTNSVPAEMVAEDPELAAVVDRFAFHNRVTYLAERESRLGMYTKYIDGATTQQRITLEDLKYISMIVVEANQIADPEFLAVFDDVLQAWKKSSKQNISDRRACKALQVCEAAALLGGRFEVDFVDIYSAGYVLVMGGDGSFEKFVAIAQPIIEKALLDRKPDIDQLNESLLANIDLALPQINAQLTGDSLILANQHYRKALEEAKAIRPNTRAVTEMQSTLVLKIQKNLELINKRINGN